MYVQLTIYVHVCQNSRLIMTHNDVTECFSSSSAYLFLFFIFCFFGGEGGASLERKLFDG